MIAMPNEHRILDFSYQEVGEALRQHGKKIKINFPDALITYIQPDEKDKDCLCLHLTSLKDARKYPYSVPLIQMAACLISYCIAKKIPLPRNAVKTIKPSPEGLALLINLPRHAKAQS